MAATATVLYVDPDPSSRERRVSVLEDAGFSVVTATGGADCLKRLEGGSVDCVVGVGGSDVDVDGLSTLVHGTSPETPFLVLGEPDGAVLPAWTIGAPVGYVPDETDLVEAIRTTVTRHRVAESLDRYRELGRALRAVARAVADGRSRDAVERTVHDELSAGDRYRFVWIGRVEPGGDTLELRLPVEGSHDTADVASLLGSDDAGFIDRAVSDREVVVAEGNAETRGGAGAGDRGSVAIAAVPFVHDDAVAAVALLASTHPGAFDGSERDLLADIGRIAAAAPVDEPEAGLDPEEFADAVIHELVNPLAVARAYVEMARDEGDLGRLDRIEGALEQIEHVLQDELTLFRRDEVGEMTLRDVGEDATEAWEGLVTDDARLEIEGSTPILANHQLAVRLLANLFDNALTHGWTDVTVRVGPLDGGFYVEDDGPGIPAAERERVFEEGYSTAGGTGLGLTIVERIADAHGWTVTATESEEGGARFEITGVTTGEGD